MPIDCPLQRVKMVSSTLYFTTKRKSTSPDDGSGPDRARRGGTQGSRPGRPRASPQRWHQTPATLGPQQGPLQDLPAASSQVRGCVHRSGTRGRAPVQGRNVLQAAEPQPKAVKEATSTLRNFCYGVRRLRKRPPQEKLNHRQSAETSSVQTSGHRHTRLLSTDPKHSPQSTGKHA